MRKKENKFILSAHVLIDFRALLFIMHLRKKTDEYTERMRGLYIFAKICVDFKYLFNFCLKAHLK